MPERDSSTSYFSGSALIRNEPVQARSTARLSGLLDAAAAVIGEIGYERLTTAMVAERAGASIGTVYRYFPDRLAVLQALALRNYERMLDRVRTDIMDPAHEDWRGALGAVLDRTVEAYRSEPGYRSIRLGDVIDIHPRTVAETANSALAGAVFDALADRYGLTAGEEGRLALQAAFEAVDGLLARAFALDEKGDERFLTSARETLFAMVSDSLDA